MHAPRRATFVIATALLAGCSQSPSASKPSPPSSASSPTSVPAKAIAPAAITGAPKQLAEVIARAYASKRADAQVPAGAKAQLGTWKGQRVAVVTAGSDVTLAATSGTAQRWSYVGGWMPSIGIANDLGGVQHVLVIGSDARPGEEVARSRGDVEQLVGVDGKGGGGVLGLARDLWVPIPGHGQGKLNSALVFAGPKGQRQAVAAVTGIPVRGYLLTGFSDFTALVDALGGISVNLPRSVQTPLGLVPAGGATLTGARALSLARERYHLPDGDFGRSGNQGRLLLAAALKARMAGVSALPRSLSVVDKYVTSDLSAADMLRFSAAFYRLNPAKVGHQVAKGGFGWSSDRQSIVILDQASKAAMVRFRTGRL